MTDARPRPDARARPRRPGRPSPLPIVLGAWTLFLVVFVLLTFQLRAGHDPALGAGTQLAQRTVVSQPAAQAPTASPTTLTTHAS